MALDYTLRLASLETEPDPGYWPRARAVTMVLERRVCGVVESATIRASQDTGTNLDTTLLDLTPVEATILGEAILEAVRMITQEPFPF